MDFIAGRGYAIGDDGTALRTDDGGATWTGLATGTSQDLTRLQAVTPDVLVVLGGDGCVVRRSDDGGKTFHKMFVLAETNCPDRVAASYFVSPEVGYLLLRDGNVLRTTDSGQTFGRGTAIPGTPASSGGGQGVPADAIFTTPDAGIVFLAGSNAAFRTTDARRLLDTRPSEVDPGAVTRMRAVSATTFYAFGPDTLLRSTDGGAELAAAARPAPATRSPGSAARPTTSACSRPTAATSCCGPRTAAHRRARSRPRPRRSTRAGFANATARSRAGAGGATVDLRRRRAQLRADRRRHRRLLPVRPAARAGERRARARRAPGAAPARSTTA